VTASYQVVRIRGKVVRASGQKVPITDVVECLESGDIPLISVTENDQIHVEVLKHGTKYVAISPCLV